MKIIIEEFTVEITDLIFKKRHEVTIPTIATISEAGTDQYGIPTSGVESIDAGMYNAPLRVYATINEQVHYWERGHYVRIRTAVIAKAIYEDIQIYLKSWVHDMNDNNSMNRSNPPTDDLRSLDRYAQHLHDVLGVRGEMSHQTADVVRILNPVPEVAEHLINTAGKKEYVRDGMADFFNSDFVNKKRI